MKTGITGVATQVYEVQEVKITNYSDGEEEPDTDMIVKYKGTNQNVETEGEVVVKTVYEEEEVNTQEDRKYTRRQRQQIKRYEPMFQQKQ